MTSKKKSAKKAIDLLLPEDVVTAVDWLSQQNVVVTKSLEDSFVMLSWRVYRAIQGRDPFTKVLPLRNSGELHPVFVFTRAELPILQLSLDKVMGLF